MYLINQFCIRLPGLDSSFTQKRSTQVLEHYTDKKQNTIFLIYLEIQMGAVVKSYMRKSFLKYEERRKYLAIYEKAVSHI